MIKNYLKVAWRNLKRSKVYSFINIFGLAIGLTCCMLIALYVWYESSYDSYHPNVDRLYQVGDIEMDHGKEVRLQGCPNTLAGLFQSVFPQVEATARICPLIGDDKSLIQYVSGNETRSFNEEKGFAADSGFFHLFRYDFVEGDASTAVSGPYSIVLSKDIADKIFRGQPALNKVIHVSSRFNGDHDYTVTGVFKPVNMPSHIDARFFVSMYGGNIGDLIRTFRNMASNYFFVTYIRLKPGTGASQIEKQLPAFVDTYEGKDLKAAGAIRKRFLIKVSDIHLHADMPFGDVTPGGSVTSLYVLSSIALFTLLIACINFMNLATARYTKRSTEVGVRKTLGASRSTLIAQFLGESLLMALIAFTIATGFTLLLFPLFEKLSGKNIVLSPQQFIGIGAVFFLLAIVTGLVAGSYPALYLSSFNPVKILKGKVTNSLAVVSLRKSLVVFQFCIAIVLIVSSVIIRNQMDFLRNADLGFNKDQQLILPLRSQTSRQLYTTLKRELQGNTGVSSVGASFFYPGINNFTGLYSAEGKASTDNHVLSINYVDFDYLKTLQIKAVSGRIFSEQFPADSVDGMVLNEEAIRQFGYEPATCINKRIYFSMDPKRSYKIVGVVKDFHFEDLHVPIGSIGFLVNSDPVYNYVIAHLNAGSIHSTVASIQRVWNRLDPTEPFEYTFLDDQFQRLYDADNRLADIVAYTTAIAILISCLGLFGLATFTAEQRVKEIGIRKVLGASERSITYLLCKDILKLVIISIIIGTPIGWFVVNKWLQNFAYRTSIDWFVFVITTVSALVIALLSTGFQAIRASMTSPVKSLRTEG